MNAIRLCLLAICALLLSAFVQASPLTGGLAGVREVDAETAKLIYPAHQKVLASRGLTGLNVKLEPVSYATQIVAGVNYFVKYVVKSSTTDYVHCRLFRPLPPNHEQIRLVECKAAEKDSPLTYF